MTTSVTILRFKEHKHGYNLLAAPGCPFQTHPFIRSSIYPPLPVPPPSVVLTNRPSASVSLTHPSGCPPSVSQAHAIARVILQSGSTDTSI